jgi:hypothetical protein
VSFGLKTPTVRDARLGTTSFHGTQTGKELYNSGDIMPAIAHLSGIAISNGRVFVTTIDSNLYSFGIEEDR